MNKGNLKDKVTIVVTRDTAQVLKFVAANIGLSRQKLLEQVANDFRSQQASDAKIKRV